MSRINLGWVRWVLAGLLIAAVVKAQDPAEPKPLIDPQATIEPPSASPSESSKSSEVLQSSRRNAASRSFLRSPTAVPIPGPATAGASAKAVPIEAEAKTPQPTELRPAKELEGTEGLRSVLKRPISKPAGSAPKPQVGDEPPAAVPLPGSIPPAPAAGEAMSPAAPGALPAPPRRTTGDSTLPPLGPRVAAKSITPRRIAGQSGTGSPRAAEAVVSSANPQIRVETKGPKAIIVGEESTFVVTMLNVGETEAVDLTARVAIPAGIQLSNSEANAGRVESRQEADGTQRVVWSVERLTGRGDRQLTLKLVPQNNRPFELPVEWTLPAISSTARIEVQQPLLQIALSGPKEIVFGETKSYSIVLSNPGTGDAKNIAIQLTLGTGTADTLNVPVVAAGESRTFDVEVTAREVGTMQITAVAKGDGKLQTEAVHQLVVLRANLQIETTGPAQQYSGSVGTYQMRVVNSGNAVARSIQAAVRLPRGVKYLKGLENAKQLSEALTWSVGDLAPNAERLFQFTCQLAADGDNTLRFGARCEGGLEAAAEVLTKVESMADLKLTVNDPKGPIPVGEDVTYEISILNRGTKAAAAVTVVAQFSEGIEPVAAEGTKSELLPGQVLFRPISQIAPNETLTLKIKARASAAGSHLFRAEVKCPDPETKLVAEQTTRYFGGQAVAAKPRPAAAKPAETNPAPADGFVPRIGARPR